MTKAVIDVGTQSTNMLICDAAGTEILRLSASTRLGQDLHLSGILSQTAIDRTVEHIATYQQRARELGVNDIVVAGTAACRRATNTEDFRAALLQATGLQLIVLTEQQEANMAFVGAVSSLPKTEGSTLVIDIGGGSTELIVGFDSPEMSMSIPFGAVTSTSSHISTDPARPEDLTNLIGAVADELEEIGRQMPAALTATRVVGIAGTILTIAAVEIGLTTFDASALHGFVLTRDAAEDVFRTLATESLAERLANPGLDQDRADIIVAGCCILVALLRRLRLDEVTISTHNLMYGLMKTERLTS